MYLKVNAIILYHVLLVKTPVKSWSLRIFLSIRIFLANVTPKSGIKKYF